MNSSLRNHELPREMKHHPAHSAEASMFGVHGNKCLRGCEYIDPALSTFAQRMDDQPSQIAQSQEVY